MHQRLINKLNQWLLGGYPKSSERFPEHERESEQLSRSNATVRRKETENLPLVPQVPKICDSVYTCPFIGRRRDFYIPKTPSSSKNIPNVNTYKNVFSISYFYKPAEGPIRRTREGGVNGSR
jgi:hypothetical protein